MPATKPTPQLESVPEQPTLMDELFARYEVPSVKVSISGTIELPLEMIDSFTQGLEPGYTVAFTCRGHVLDVSAPYRVDKNDWLGRLVLKAETLEGIEAI